MEKEIVTKVREYLDGRPDINPAAFGAHTSFASSTVRHVLDGQRECSKQMGAELARVLRLAECGEIFPIGAEPVTITEERTEPGRRIRKSRDFYKTQTVRRIAQVLTFAAEQCVIGVITADYGVGKTEAVKHWRATTAKVYESVVFEFDEFSGRNAVDFVESLADLLGVPYQRGPHNGGRTMRAVCARLVEQPCLLILDQCEAVNPRVMQITRQIWDHTRDAGVGIVLLSAPVLMQRLQGSNMRDLGALQSRVSIWAQLTGLAQEEMAQILKQEGIAPDDAAFRLWYRAVGGSMRRLMASVELVHAKHAGKAITEKTVAQIAGSLWGMSVGGAMERVA